MLLTHARVFRLLDEQLMRAHRVSVSEFDVLITLENAEGGRQRMSDLADAVILSPSGLTRLVGRLEKDGLVERRAADDDKRSFLASLTPAGRQRLAEARVTHNAVIREHFLDQLSTVDQQRLRAIWLKSAPPPDGERARSD